MKSFILFLLFGFFLSRSYGGDDYELKPVVHSNKWYNGAEWAIDTKEGIEIRVLFNDFTNGKLLFSLLIKNHTDTECNIDPDSIYYLAIRFNKELISKFNPKSSPRQPPMSPAQVQQADELHYKGVVDKHDTIRIENPDRLIRTLKGLIGLGFLFDSDNVAINRGYAKMDNYKENLLLKHTIEAHTSLSKILVLDGYEFIEELSLRIWIQDKEFVFPFRHVK